MRPLGQVDEVPEHTVVESQSPEAVWQVVPALPGACTQVPAEHWSVVQVLVSGSHDEEVARLAVPVHVLGFVLVLTVPPVLQGFPSSHRRPDRHSLSPVA